MSVGDLIHPQESMDPAIQAAVIIEHASHASRWHVAHLLLFVGILVVIPGVLAMTGLTAERTPRGGYASRIRPLVGVASFAAIFLGVGAMAVPLIRADELLRWPALAFVVGAICIGAEIITAQVLLSQIGNLAFLGGVILFARQILRRRHATEPWTIAHR